MTDLNREPKGTSVRWLVAGQLTEKGGALGTCHITRETFALALERAKLALRVTVPDRIGADAQKTYEVSFTKLRSFSAQEVARSVPELRALLDLARSISEGGKETSREDAAQRVEQQVGRGRLYEAVVGRIRRDTDPSPMTGSNGSGTHHDNPLEGIFAKADVPDHSNPRAAVDSFVRAMRKSPGATPTVSVEERSASRVIERIVFTTASELLSEASVAHLEAVWRGLQVLAEQCTASAGMCIELLDVKKEHILEALRVRMSRDDLEAPDGIVVFDTIDNHSRAIEIGNIAADMRAPCIISVPWGSASRIIDEADARDDAWAQAWNEVRDSEAARWLCAATNRIVLHTEREPASMMDPPRARRTEEGTERVVLGSPAFAVAGLIAASYRDGGHFGRVLGANGSLKSPAVWTLQEGVYEGTAVPTEVFASIRMQTDLAARGIVALGSARNSDRILLSAIPTVSNKRDAFPLPAQILTGRIVRFASWVRDQLPSTTQPEEIPALFREASAVLLFPGDAGNAKFDAQVTDNNGRSIVIRASVPPEHALIPFDVEFALPFRTDETTQSGPKRLIV